MFNRSGQIYTVHENPAIADPAERVELVREGFSFWAFVLNVVWLAGNRLWLAFFIYAALIVIVVQLGQYTGASEVSMGMLQLALQLLLGLSAHDIQRARLARKGYRETGVVVAESELIATQRAFGRIAA